MAASEFFDAGSSSSGKSLAILHLRRDNLIPVKLSNEDAEQQGYDEGAVTNTRFGSFPHSTLVNVPWGSQVRASKVDTGSRGRREKSKKRKRDVDLEVKENGPPPDSLKAPKDASSGFLHVLPPTPESWTTSLPHRTQVVYTPDYSYILHRIRARPGSVLLEAGAGSGSFTHAAARAVYDGIDPQSRGHVWSFEFHEERFQKMQVELEEHGLAPMVTITHRDVYENGFQVSGEMKVNAIFLDLPSPWLAIPHLKRTSLSSANVLDPSNAVHLCVFSPCIEQVQRTMALLRDLDWIDVEMVELSHKRIEIRREKIETDNASPASVDEAVYKLANVEKAFRDFHKGAKNKDSPKEEERPLSIPRPMPPKEGRLTHRSEPEIKTHTSYLVFAILPQLWTDSDEERAHNATAQS